MSINPADWIGRSETTYDEVTRAPFVRLAELLNREPEPDAVPPMGHLLCFPPSAPQALLGEDGHPLRGGIVPPLTLPMRMAAGSRVRFHESIPFGSDVRRRSTITGLAHKEGRTGRLAFLTLRHEIFLSDRLCLTEDADIVFREKSGNIQPPAPGERRSAQATRILEPSASLLFRFSALTYNAHRIHYDRDYATQAEGYPGLVVHGPLLATLLMDHFRTHRPRDVITGFTFRAQRPVFDLAPFSVNLTDTQQGADVWACDGEGYVAMAGSITVAG